ncbi:DUF2182 domain-containing protein [Halosimplex pelagicum]|uniref:DUF2182 domain-containing protein n=1 Tax=Halosimplex pelagicum TaxID=869886 RepID=A0A7D5TDL1_9EURY|nr:DUF2182 domain-containing protein [Halosimplex pelagicum]QLH84033.1 DUF2182 domain-containing protein [Halosimplex pelagicum]
MSTHARLRQYRDRLTDAVVPDELPPAPVGVTLVTLALWTVLLGGWLPMPSMPGPATAPGVFEAMGTSNGLAGALAYLLAWGTMMSAMMYPAMLPLVRRYTRESETDGWGAGAGVAALLLAYSSVWTAAGLVPLLVDALVGISGLTAAHGPLLVGGLGLFVAWYQRTDHKRSALRECCGSVSFDGDALSLEQGARKGIDHGVECVRATWPLFALMVVAGSMNPVVMLGLTLVVTAERMPPWEDEMATAVGVAAGVGGLAVLLLPGLLP